MTRSVYAMVPESIWGPVFVAVVMHAERQDSEKTLLCIRLPQDSCQANAMLIDAARLA